MSSWTCFGELSARSWCRVTERKDRGMTANTKIAIALIGSFALAAWGASELLRAALDPIIRSLGA